MGVANSKERHPAPWRGPSAVVYFSLDGGPGAPQTTNGTSSACDSRQGRAVGKASTWGTSSSLLDCALGCQTCNRRSETECRRLRMMYIQHSMVRIVVNSCVGEAAHAVLDALKVTPNDSCAVRLVQFAVTVALSTWPKVIPVQELKARFRDCSIGSRQRPLVTRRCLRPPTLSASAEAAGAHSTTRAPEDVDGPSLLAAVESCDTDAVERLLDALLTLEPRDGRRGSQQSSCTSPRAPESAAAQEEPRRGGAAAPKRKEKKRRSKKKRAEGPSTTGAAALNPRKIHGGADDEESRVDESTSRRRIADALAYTTETGWNALHIAAHRGLAEDAISFRYLLQACASVAQVKARVGQASAGQVVSAAGDSSTGEAGEASVVRSRGDSDAARPRRVSTSAPIIGDDFHHDDAIEHLSAARPGSRVDHPPGVKELESVGWAPLHLAVRSGNSAIVEILLGRAQSFVSGRAPDGLASTPPSRQDIVRADLVGEVIHDGSKRNAFHVAAQYGRFQCMLMLVEAAGFDRKELLSARDAAGYTPLHYACSTPPQCAGGTGIVELLLPGAGAAASRARPAADCEEDIRAVTTAASGLTALHLVAMKGSRRSALAIVRAARAVGLDGNAACKRGYTALHYAAMLGREDVLEVLIGFVNVDAPRRRREPSPAGDLAGLICDVDSASESNAFGDGSTPLFIAIARGQTECVRKLLRNSHQRVDPSACADDGSTALHISAQFGRADYVDLIVSAWRESQWTKRFKDVSLERVLNAADERGATPLHVAAKAGHHEFIARLLAHQFDAKSGEPVLRILQPTMPCRAGGRDLSLDGTALHLACFWGRADCVRLLVDAEKKRAAAAATKRARGRATRGTKKEQAVYPKRKKVHATKKLDTSPSVAGADIVNLAGFTPLEIAAMRGHTACIKILLGSGLAMDADAALGLRPGFARALYLASLRWGVPTDPPVFMQSDCVQALLGSSRSALSALLAALLWPDLGGRDPIGMTVPPARLLWSATRLLLFVRLGMTVGLAILLLDVTLGMCVYLCVKSKVAV